jgi:two-component sensor histidine kinase
MGRTHEIEESERRYRAIFEHSHISLWEEDYSVIYAELARLKEEGVDDIGAYLRQHTDVLTSLISSIKILDVNEATLGLYNAASKEELLGSLNKIFIDDSLDVFVEEMAAIAEGKRYFEGETPGRKLTGEAMDLLLRITVPRFQPNGDDWEDYRYVLVAIVDISERKRREREIQELLRKEKEQRLLAESLRATSLALTSSMDPSEVLDRIIEQVRKIIDYDAVNVCLFEDEKIQIVRSKGYEKYGIGEDEIERLYNSEILSNVEQLKKFKRPMMLSDTRADPAWIPFIPTKWVRTFLGIPIVLRNEIIGMINFDSETPNAFDPALIDLLEPFGHAAAVALENARLYQEAQREIADRKDAEEQLSRSLQEKEVLLKEIHHRVKNNLSVVASLLNLHSSKIETVEQAKEALFAGQNRVYAMSMVHESLYESADLSSIDVSEYLGSLVQKLCTVYDVSGRIDTQFEAESFILDIDRAVPLGLILNELISNAFSHAFAEDGRGSVWIELKREGEKMVHLSVRDDGVGIDMALVDDHEESLGLQLVHILSEQIGGRAEFKNGGGTRVSILFQRGP